MAVTDKKNIIYFRSSMTTRCINCWAIFAICLFFSPSAAFFADSRIVSLQCFRTAFRVSFICFTCCMQLSSTWSFTDWISLMLSWTRGMNLFIVANFLKDNQEYEDLFFSYLSELLHQHLLLFCYSFGDIRSYFLHDRCRGWECFRLLSRRRHVQLCWAAIEFNRHIRSSLPWWLRRSTLVWLSRALTEVVFFHRNCGRWSVDLYRIWIRTVWLRKSSQLWRRIFLNNFFDDLFEIFILPSSSPEQFL